MNEFLQNISDSAEPNEKLGEKLADKPIFSVSQLSALIQNTLSQKFSNIKIRAEISGFKRHTSGHLYFDLKDESSVVNSVCWRGVASKIKFPIQDGLEVIVTGSISTYPARSNYQLVVNSMEIAGEGALMAMLEERKRKLAAEGLFDAERKLPLPYMPATIGIITSQTGAVIRDILHRLSDRFGVRALVYPVQVQGERAANEVCSAIEFFNVLDKNSNNNPNNIPRPDVLIVARGGGALVDLMPFNEESVVRATAASAIPIISAIGHETDTTLIDFASSKHAPTPTAAAELATPVKSELLAYVFDLKARQFSAVNRYIENYKRILNAKASGLISPKQKLNNMSQRLDISAERLHNAIKNSMQTKQRKLDYISLKPQILINLIERKTRELVGKNQLLASYNYRNVLSRGFALVRDDKNKLTKSANLLAGGQGISIEFFDGAINAVVGNSRGDERRHEVSEEIKNAKIEKIKKPQKQAKQTASTSQESLF